MPENLTNNNSTLVQVMAWCRQATSHYLSPCWSRSMSLYGNISGTGPQWLNAVLHIWATLPKWVPPHIQNWPSPIFMKMHRRIHRCINNRYSKYRHSINNRFGENELWKVSRASLWHLLGVIEDIDDLILTAFVVKIPSFKKCIHKQKKLLFASPAPMPISKSICETIC